MVMTDPLDGLSGVVKRDVVVDEAAHAAGPAVSNARALNSTGINRPSDTCLEVIPRLNATMGEYVMAFKAPDSFGLQKILENCGRKPDRAVV
jgi:hypothetical protein